MIATFALVLTLTSLAIALHVGVAAGVARYRWVRVIPYLVVVQALTIVLAASDLIRLVTGRAPQQMSTHIAYLVVTLAVVPAAAIYARGADGRWAGLLVACALVVLAVVVVRMQATGHPAA